MATAAAILAVLAVPGVESAIKQWVRVRWLVWVDYGAQRASLRRDGGVGVSLTMTNLSSSGFTTEAGGVPVPEVAAFESATAAAAMTAPAFAGAGSVVGGATSPTLCVRELVRPDGIRRVLVVQADGDMLQWTLYAEGSPIRPAAALNDGYILVALPDLTPLMLTPMATGSRADTLSVRAAMSNGPVGSLDLTVDNRDAVSAKPSFGWTPADQASTWAPAGRPDDWPVTITVAVARLPGGIGLGFDRADHLLIADENACHVVDPVAGGRELRTFPFHDDWSYQRVDTVVISPNGNRVFTNKPSGWSVYDGPTGERLTRREMENDESVYGVARGRIAYALDGRDLIIGDNTRIRRYTADGSARLAKVPACTWGVGVGAGTVISADDGVGQSTAVVRDRETLAARHSFPILHDYTGLTLSTDDRWLASSGQSGVGLYDVATGRQLFDRRPNRLWQGLRSVDGEIAFLPGNRWLVVASSGCPYLIDVPKGRWLFQLASVGSCKGVAVSPDGRWLALLGWTDTKLLPVSQLLAVATAATRPAGTTPTTR